MLSWAGPAALFRQLLILVICGRSIPTWHHCGCQVRAEECGAGQEWQTFLSSMLGHGERDRCSVRQGEFASSPFQALSKLSGFPYSGTGWQLPSASSSDFLAGIDRHVDLITVELGSDFPTLVWPRHRFWEAMGHGRPIAVS